MKLWHSSNMAAATAPDLSALDIDALRAMVIEQHAVIERLQTMIAHLRRMQFGRKSEKIDRQVEQLELELEELESAKAARLEELERKLEPVKAAAVAAVRKPVRRPLPNHLPREVETHMPAAQGCPACGAELNKLGEDVSEVLEWVPASFKVIRHVRPKMCCTKCDVIVQAEAPSRPIARGMAGPGLLAHVLVSKYADHLPLHRQSEIYAREGVDLERSTLADWVGSASKLLEPLNDALRKHVISADKLHADDTPVPVLEPGKGRTKTGRLWTYVRDERPAGQAAAPAVWFAYTPDRSGKHPMQHLENFKGTLQADAYAGFNRLYDSGDVKEAACWAPYDLHVVRTENWNDAEQNPITREDVEQLIGSDPDLSWSTSDYVDMKDGEKMTRYYFIEWRGSPTFLWYRDQITCTTPNEEQTLKLIDIASRLSAHVSGDDDERYVLSRTLLGQKKVKAIRP
jgi:transposase